MQNETELLALALLQIRLLLADSLGSVNDAPIQTRIAAHLAYALHNEAEIIHKGRPVDVNVALARIAAIDSVLGVEDGKRFVQNFQSRMNSRSSPLGLRSVPESDAK
jgi:hypothetical protein